MADFMALQSAGLKFLDPNYESEIVPSSQENHSLRYIYISAFKITSLSFRVFNMSDSEQF